MLKKIKENKFYIILLFILMIFSAVYYVILKKEKFEEDVSGYLTYVPLTYEYNVNGKDAYSGDTISVDDMSEELLLKYVFYQVEPVKYNMYFLSDNCLGNTCYGKRTEKISEVKKTMRKYYNIKDIETDSFNVPIGTVFAHDKYFVEIDFERRGSYPTKYSEVVKFEKTDKELIIYEKAGFLIKHSEDKSALHFNTTDDSVVTEFKNGETINEEGQEFYNNNKTKFKTFKHTFKLNKKHEYYYYKTEQTK